MKVVYAVEWIEVEFGSRPEGYKLFLDKDVCIRQTKEDSRNGPYDGGYLGPVRSLMYIEVPFDSLEDDLKKKLLEKGTTFTDNNWGPKFNSKAFYIH